MVRYKFLLGSVLCWAFFAQGCVHGDLDDCPPMVQYAVAFTYTNHVWNKDRFYDDVKTINLYVFDANNLVYTTTTELSPYEEKFNIPLDLPMGNYTILAWGNVSTSGPFTITPANFIKGKTTLSEARLTLQKTRGDLNDTRLEKLFFGEIHATVPLYVSRIDTIPLTNDTKNVRVVLHWNTKNVSLGSKVDHSNVVVRLNGRNAKYKFDNSNDALSVAYAPYMSYPSDSILKAGVGTTVRDGNNPLRIDYADLEKFTRLADFTETTVYDFTTLRLFADLPLNLSIEYWQPEGNNQYIKKPVHEADIINRYTGFPYLFAEDMRIAENQWQNSFDKYDFYRVDVFIVQEESDTFVTGSILIKDWWVVKDDTSAGMK